MWFKESDSFLSGGLVLVGIVNLIIGVVGVFMLPEIAWIMIPIAIGCFLLSLW